MPKPHPEDLANLAEPISEKECENCLNNMEVNETPGQDGLPFWSDMLSLLARSPNFLLRNGVMSPSKSVECCELLPKLGKTLRIQEVTDPLIPRAWITELPPRLQRILHRLVDESQKGFISIRQITDNVRLFMDVMKYADSANFPGAIDLHKAFDSVRWNFTNTVLSGLAPSLQFSCGALKSSVQRYILLLPYQTCSWQTVR